MNELNDKPKERTDRKDRKGILTVHGVVAQHKSHHTDYTKPIE